MRRWAAAGTWSLGEMKNNHICVICGRNRATTRDHIPPAGIFAKPRPNDLLTIPCCKECNEKDSVYDERFKVFLSLHVSYMNPDETQIMEKLVIPTLENNIQIGNCIFANSERVLLQIRSGLLLGPVHAIKWDNEAHDHILERMIRGFHWHHTRTILGEKAKVKVVYLSEINRELAKVFEPYPVQSIANNQVLYKGIYHKDVPYRSLWLFQFFNQKWSGGYTMPT